MKHQNNKRNLAVALCRVSSIEQLENNSLGYQKDIVLKTAEELGVTIPSDGVWQGAVSSKKGVNHNRKDLVEIFEYCKRHKSVSYLIVSEVDRFMRSPDEQTYWFVKFLYEIGVKVWFADKLELNNDTNEAGLLRYFEGYRAAGSNFERQTKSINGLSTALKEGRYPFSPKPGYKGGIRKGIHDIHPIRGPALKKVLIDIALHRLTPSQGLIELNKSDFMKGHSVYKMDKFRVMVTDPFYAGIVEIDKQIKVRNESGLHDPLISIDQHKELIRIMNHKVKIQSGPLKSGNPKYPLNNIISCDNCKDKTNGRLVGFDHSNGKGTGIVYEKYRCRSCKKYIKRSDLHEQLEKQFSSIRITEKDKKKLLKELDIIWKQEELQSQQEEARLGRKITDIHQTIDNHIEAATDPSNANIKEDILLSISKKKDELSELENKLYFIKSDAMTSMNKFLNFALDFIDNMGRNFLDSDLVSKENRLRCKLLVFPAGFYLNNKNKVHTPEISIIYRLMTNKKDTEVSRYSHMVRVTGL
jgi:DNA invertase Pin-like site-specific DNA recombinase